MSNDLFGNTPKPPPAHAKRLAVSQFKNDHNIWTYRSTGIAITDNPWSAMLVDPKEAMKPAELIADRGVELEEQGLLVYGATQIAAVKALAEANNLPHDFGER